MANNRNEPAPFPLHDALVQPGSAEILTIPVSQQVTGLSAHLALQVMHGARPGPCIFVSAAIHGDEIVGTAIIQRLIESLSPETLAGTIIFVPAVNIYGFAAHSRYLPDRRDLNRSFPGNEKGSLASQLANAFLVNVIEPSSLGIDLHSAAVHRYNLPQVRIDADNPKLAELAAAFGAPIIIESSLRPGSMRALAAEMGTPMILMEAGEALRFDRYSIETGTAGVLRVLAHLGMIDPDGSLPQAPPPLWASRSTWIRAPRGGVSRRAKRSGDIVSAGDLLARVGGLFGEEPADLLSPIDGVIIGHATLPVVNQGDALFHVAHVDTNESHGEDATSITDGVLAGPTPCPPMLDEDEIL